MHENILHDTRRYYINNTLLISFWYTLIFDWFGKADYSWLTLVVTFILCNLNTDVRWTLLSIRCFCIALLTFVVSINEAFLWECLWNHYFYSVGAFHNFTRKSHVDTLFRREWNSTLLHGLYMAYLQYNKNQYISSLREWTSERQTCLTFPAKVWHWKVKKLSYLNNFSQ